MNAYIDIVNEAHTRGRKDYAEGVPGNQNPFTNKVESQAWMTGWWSGFRDYPPNKKAVE